MKIFDWLMYLSLTLPILFQTTCIKVPLTKDINTVAAKIDFSLFYLLFFVQSKQARFCENNLKPKVHDDLKFDRTYVG